MKNIKLLSIETSCDETAISVLEIKEGKNINFKVLANITASQVKLHEQYGGVFPMMAKREHGIALPIILEKILKILNTKTQKNKDLVQSSTLHTSHKEEKIRKILTRENGLFETTKKVLEKYQKPDIDMIVVTEGPGLEPALWVGINFAKALSVAWDIPLVPADHMEGHILSIFVQGNKKTFSIPKIKFPVISLLVSGGHTELVLVHGWGKYKKIGETRDDAVGEAFDKVARMLGLAYPGGPKISKLAEKERRVSLPLTKGEVGRGQTPPRPSPYQGEGKITLPRPMIHSKDFDFSFSGLKTAVLYTIRDLKKIDDKIRSQIAREFEDSAVEVLVAKTMKAVKFHKAKTIIVGGGVSANTYLQKELKKTAKENKTDCLFPARALTTDNALMIAIAGYFASKRKRRSMASIKAKGNLSL